MNSTAVATRTAPARRGLNPTPRRPRRNWSRTVVMLVAIFGVGLLMYPQAASWISSLHHNTALSGYAQRIENLPDSTTATLLDQARSYNHDLPAGPLRDAYTPNSADRHTTADADFQTYLNQLAVPGTDAMARVRIPAIGVDLPVYHGTDDATLTRGVGHLYGSSLPVGGDGSHAVLTGHSGYVHSALFDDLNQVQVGDSIVASVLGEDLHYQVTRILVVLPSETESLQQEPGKDLLTLVTCTPTGVNTHRLLVQAERVAAPDATDGTQRIATGPASAGFPWWALVMVGVPLVVFLLTRPQPGRGTRARRQLTGAE